jgi:hypothetical protein
VRNSNAKGPFGTTPPATGDHFSSEATGKHALWSETQERKQKVVASPIATAASPPRFRPLPSEGPTYRRQARWRQAAGGGRPVRPEVTRCGGWRDRKMEPAARKEDGDAGGCAAGARGGTEEETHRRAGGWPASSMRDASLAG